MLEILSNRELLEIAGGSPPTSKDPAVNLGLRIGYVIGETVREMVRLINPFD